MATLAVLAIVAGTAVQTYGQLQQGKVAAAEGKAAQQIAEHNAKIKERQAAAELERARAEAERFGREGEALLGEQQVALAKGGVLATTGTPALLLEETADELKADRMQILKGGFLAESFRLSEAEALRFEGRAARARGRYARSASRLFAATTILTGGGATSMATYRLPAFGTGANSFS